jgi:two-component system OmpR family sensor kinase
VSLRLRLLLAVGLVAVIALAGADVAVYESFRGSLISSLDATLDAAHLPIERQLAGPAGVGKGTGPAPLPAPSPPPPGSGTPGADFCLHVGLQLGAGTVVEVRTPKGVVLDHSSCVGGVSLTTSAGPVLPAAHASSGLAGTGSSAHFDAKSADSSTAYRVSETLLANGNVLVLAAPLAATNRSLSKLVFEELITSLIALALAIALGSWLVRMGLRPLFEVERTANAITGGDLTQRVPGEDRRSEVGNVARAINTMLRRIEGAFAARDATEGALRDSEARLRQFVADASHELRTPIAAVSAYAELFSTGAAEPEHRADLERVMVGIRDETSRMGGVVEDLLLLARLDEGRPLLRRPVELVALCSEAIRTASTVGPEWPVSLEAVEPIELLADPERLRQVMDNLLLNVRAHTPAGTSTIVRVRSDGEHGLIDVIDDGPGFAVDEVDRVFERFYRGDPSRARSSGGSGLGLAIVASIVERHGGSVRAANVEDGGARVTVSLALNAE